MVGAGAVLTYAMHGFSGLLSRDLALYSYAGQQVAEGVPPYVGVMNRAGPLAHLLPAVGVLVARLGGWDDLLVMRLWFMVIATCARAPSMSSVVTPSAPGWPAWWVRAPS